MNQYIPRDYTYNMSSSMIPKLDRWLDVRDWNWTMIAEQLSIGKIIEILDGMGYNVNLVVGKKSLVQVQQGLNEFYEATHDELITALFTCLIKVLNKEISAKG